jgi:hypothetical protein
MAESTSRTPHKLEYTSCINTTTPSPTAITTYHSSFDFISEPRDCDTLLPMNQNNNSSKTHKTLERDLRRLDINSNQRILETNNRKLDRTASISLPTTPTEQISPSYEYSHLLTLKNQIDTDYENDEQSPIDCISNSIDQETFQQQITDETILNSKK